MNVVLAYCNRDYEITKVLLEWIQELGGCAGHRLLLCRDARLPEAIVEPISALARTAFGDVRDLAAPAPIDGWPEGANYFFRLCTNFMSYQADVRYFLWLEPDAIPLRQGWLEALEKEFVTCGKPFMGDRVEVKIEGQEVPLHMSGVGIYPNPLYQFAGEAYRAAELAFDMAGKDQIVPRAHWTKLIEHAWRHGSFQNPHELTTQIRPEAVLFHASKDGSLIRILRQRKAVNYSGVPSLPIWDKATHFPAAPVLAEPTVDVPTGDAGGGREPISCDIFIRTYPTDYPWLQHCLRAIGTFASGFRKVWVISPQDNPIPLIDTRFIEWRKINPETEDGYLDQQISKLYADVLTDYQADFILHIDSDVILNRPVTPQNFLLGDMVIWPYTPYPAIQTPWQAITEKFMGRRVPYEFMRRFPIMVPRWIYPRLREFCFKEHKMPLCDYVKMQPQREFSEFNALGAYAYYFHRDRFRWVDTLEEAYSSGFAKQYHSYGGITPEIKTEIETILSGGGVPDSERAGKSSPPLSAQNNVGGTEILACDQSESACPHLSESDHSVPPQIKVLKNDVWVLEGDQISRWVEEEGRLDHDQNLLPNILKHINPGDQVIDAGAFIGDHTVAYASKEGTVLAFEPNPIARACLVHNTRNLPNVVVYPFALGDAPGTVPLSGNNGNMGGAYVGEHMKLDDVPVRCLDQWEFAPNFIKLDVEGYEFKALMGAEKTIDKHHPVMVIEINREALRRQNSCPEDVYGFLKNRGYEFHVMQENCSFDSPLFDIFCQPNAPEPRTTYGEMIAAILLLKNFAEIDTNHRIRVMTNLSSNGLTPRWRKKSKRKKK